MNRAQIIEDLECERARTEPGLWLLVDPRRIFPRPTAEDLELAQRVMYNENKRQALAGNRGGRFKVRG